MTIEVLIKPLQQDARFLQKLKLCIWVFIRPRGLQKLCRGWLWGCKSCSVDLERTLIFATSTVWMAYKSSIVATQLMHGWSFVLTCDNFYNFICTQVACRPIYLLTGYGKEQRNSNW